MSHIDSDLWSQVHRITLLGTNHCVLRIANLVSSARVQQDLLSFAQVTLVLCVSSYIDRRDTVQRKILVTSFAEDVSQMFFVSLYSMTLGSCLPHVITNLLVVFPTRSSSE